MRSYPYHKVCLWLLLVLGLGCSEVRAEESSPDSPKQRDNGDDVLAPRNGGRPSLTVPPDREGPTAPSLEFLPEDSLPEEAYEDDQYEFGVPEEFFEERENELGEGELI